MWLTGWIWLLWILGIWNPDLLRLTVLWLVFGGIRIAFQGIQAVNPNSEFRETIGDQFKFLLFFELIVNAYPLSLAWELGLLVVFSLIGVVSATAEHTPSGAPLVKLCNGMIATIVIILVTLAFWHVFQDPGQVFSWSGLEAFCAPIYLTLLLIPFGYFFSVWAGYETLFLRCFFPHKMMPSSVRRYGKLRLFWICGLNANRTRRAQHFLSPELRWLTTRAEVAAELDRLQEELSWEKEPT